MPRSPSFRPDTGKSEKLACETADVFDWQDLRYFIVAALAWFIHGCGKRTRGEPRYSRTQNCQTCVGRAGAKLIDWQPRSTRLTEHGQVLFSVASDVDMSIAAVIRHLHAHPHGPGPAGTVTISSLPALATQVIAPSLASLRSSYPGIDVILSATSAVSSLERGEADIALGLVRPPLPGRFLRQLGALHFGLYALATILEQPSQDWRFIGFEESLGGIAQQQWLAEFAGARAMVLRTNDVMAQCAAALAGVGIALLPCLLGDANTDLVRLPSPVFRQRPLWSSVHSDIRRSPAVRMVMEHLIQTLDH